MTRILRHSRIQLLCREYDTFSCFSERTSSRSRSRASCPEEVSEVEEDLIMNNDSDDSSNSDSSNDDSNNSSDSKDSNDNEKVSPGCQGR